MAQEERTGDIARRYGVAERTVKRWRAMGKRCRRLAPLDDPAAMAEWWGYVSRKPVPAAILEARKGGGLFTAASAEEPEEAVDLDQMEVPADLGAEVLAREVAAVAGELRGARLKGDRAKVAAAQRQLRDLTAALRQLQRTNEELARKAGKMVMRDEVVSWITRRETRACQAVRAVVARAVNRARDEALAPAVEITDEAEERFKRAMKDERAGMA